MKTFENNHIPWNKGMLETPKLEGLKFERWTIISFEGRSFYKRSNGKIENYRIWRCKCDCGTIRKVSERSLKTGKSKSCGCYAKEVASSLALPEDGAIKNHIFDGYKRGATKRGYSFELTKEEFLKLILEDCHYCGQEPSQTIKSSYSSPNFKYNGIDRKDNKVGYTIENSLPCCGICNQAKMDLEYNQFLELIFKIYNKHK